LENSNKKQKIDNHITSISEKIQKYKALLFSNFPTEISNPITSNPPLILSRKPGTIYRNTIRPLFKNTPIQPEKKSVFQKYTQFSHKTSSRTLKNQLDLQNFKTTLNASKPSLLRTANFESISTASELSKISSRKDSVGLLKSKDNFTRCPSRKSFLRPDYAVKPTCLKSLLSNRSTKNLFDDVRKSIETIQKLEKVNTVFVDLSKNRFRKPINKRMGSSVLTSPLNKYKITYM